MASENNEELYAYLSEGEENYYSCLYCGATFDTEEERDSHTFEKHMDTVEQKLREISELAEEHKETIDNWRDQKRKEFLLKISQERPQLLHEIQCSTHGEEMLDRMVEEDLFKRALKVKTLSSFEAMWLKHPKFEEVYEAEKRRLQYPYEHEDRSTGQSEETIEIPSSPESKKVLEKKTPVNRVSFKDGKLILEPEYEPERLPRNVIKYAGNREDLSDEDRRRKQMILVLSALIRKKGSN